MIEFVIAVVVVAIGYGIYRRFIAKKAVTPPVNGGGSVGDGEPTWPPKNDQPVY